MIHPIHEYSLMQEIKVLVAKGKIRDSVALTASTGQSSGSKLTAQAAEPEIKKLIPTIRQRLSAAKFYLDAIENMNYAPYLERQSSLSEEQKSLIDFSDIDLYVQIDLLNPDAFPLVVFILLNGFFSNLVGSEDCVAKVINIVYDLMSYDSPYSSSHVRQGLEKKARREHLTLHLRRFHAVSRKNKKEVIDKKGSPFNIAKEIRNQLTHDQIEEVIDFPPQFTLSGSPPDPNLYLKNSFFPNNSPLEDTEMIICCHRVFEETISFVDECYRLIERKLQRSGSLPV